MAKRKQKAIDPAATLDQATAAVEAGDKGQARTLLRVYRRWRLAGNTAPPGSDKRYSELVDRSGPEIIVRMAEPSPDDPPRPAADVLRPLARLLISMADRIREKYQGVEVDPVAALREAEAALERGDLEEAGKHIEDYDGFCVCGGRELPGGKEKHDLLWSRLSVLRREPWYPRSWGGPTEQGGEASVCGRNSHGATGAARLDWPASLDSLDDAVLSVQCWGGRADNAFAPTGDRGHPQARVRRRPARRLERGDCRPRHAGQAGAGRPAPRG